MTPPPPDHRNRNGARARTLDVPELVQTRALSNGAAGRAWLDTLPDVVAALAERWGLTLGQSYRGGTAGYVVAATDEAGAERVLKVAMPLDLHEFDSFRRSVRVHQLADGRGCAQLIDVDESAPAMLLERLGPNLDDLGFTTDEIIDTVAATLRSFWRPVDASEPFPNTIESADWLANYITTTWEELGHPCSAAVIDRALEYCGERAAAFDPDDVVLAHADAHGWNTLSAGDGQFKFVDPEGLISERAHDLAVPMREYNEPLLVGDTARLTRARAERLATLCDVDPEPVWQWGYIERVSTGLVNLRDFGEAGGSGFLEVADRCL